MLKTSWTTAIWMTVISVSLLAQQGQQPAPKTSSTMDAEGTAQITRVLPLSPVLSPEARRWMIQFAKAAQQMPSNVQELRALADAAQARTVVAAQSQYPTTIVNEKIDGVPVRIVTPPTIPQAKRDRVLICLHAGAFLADWGSATESIPIASLTQTKVVAVQYRLSPENAFPAALDDVLTVYRSLLKTYPASKIGVYGTSAGAVLTGELAVKLKQLKMPLPAALGIFAGWGDFSKGWDSVALYSLNGVLGPIGNDCRDCDQSGYVGKTDPRDPVLSPALADLKGLPPTFFLTSTRDTAMGGTVLLHRAFLNAGVAAELVVFEGLPHAFWAAGPRNMPEAIEANKMIASFLDRHVGAPAR